MALLALLPWALLTAGGGIHNHALPVTGIQSAADDSAPARVPAVHQAAVAEPDAPCLACLWQLQSGATAEPTVGTTADPIFPPRAPTSECLARGATAPSFAPRAPPLS